MLPVSVVIPHHNRPIVANALASVRSQTMKPGEIIVVDDASDSQYRDTLKACAPDARIIYLEKSQGPAGARNAGVRAATHEWVAFLDDDDEWLPHKLERQWRSLSRDPSLSAVGNAMIVVSTGQPRWDLISHSPEIMTLEAALVGTVAMLQASLIRAADILSVGGFDAAMTPFEDKEFWIRFTAAGLRGRYEREPLAILNRQPMKRLTANWRRNASAQLKIIAKHRQMHERVLGPGAARMEESKCLRRAGLERGGIAGRLSYGAGCLWGGQLKDILRMMAKGKMAEVPFVAATNWGTQRAF